LPAFAICQASHRSLATAPQVGDAQYSNLKTVYAAVLDKNQNPITDLKREDFLVLEKVHPVEIVAISSASTGPLLIGVAIDSSRSVGRNLQRGKELDVLYRSLRCTLTSSDRASVTRFQ
jgi:hypothetical protein